MKKIELVIQVKDLDNQKTFTQHIAGGLCTESTVIKPIILDAETNKELLYKILINTAAVYCRSQDPTMDNFCSDIVKAKEIIQDFLNKNP